MFDIFQTKYTLIDEQDIPLVESYSFEVRNLNSLFKMKQKTPVLSDRMYGSCILIRVVPPNRTSTQWLNTSFSAAC